MLVLASLSVSVGAAPVTNRPDADSARARATSGFLEGLARAASPRLRALEAQRRDTARRLASVARPSSGPTSEAVGFHSSLSDSVTAIKWVQADLGAELPMDAIALVPAHVVGGSHPGPGYGFPVRFRVETADEDAFAHPKLLADYTAEDFPSPGDSPVVVETPGHRARFVRVTATKLWQRGEFCTFALGELIVLRGELDIALGRPVTASDRINTLPQWSLENLVDGQSVLGLPTDAVPSPANGYHSLERERRQDAVKWVQVDLGRVVAMDEVRLIPSRPRDYAHIAGFGFPLRFRVEAAEEPEFTSPIRLRSEDTEDFRNPGENAVVIACGGRSARFVRVTATKLWLRGDYYAFALAELQVMSGGSNVALGGAVRAHDSVEYGFWSTNALVDGFSSQQRLVPIGGWLRSLGQRPALEARLQQLDDERARLVGEVLRVIGRWSIGAVAIFALALGFLGYRYRLLRLLELARLRTRIATDLHDELGTRLTRIGLLSDSVERQTDDQHPAKPQVAQISSMTREMVRTMDEIVWAVNPRNDTLDDLANYIFHFTQEFFRDTPVHCRLDVPAELPSYRLNTEVRHNLFLAVKEALNNLLRHARAMNARVAFELNDCMLTLTVQDDGRGFASSEARPNGNGLRNMRQRLEAVGGRAEVMSEADKGTTVRFCVKLKPARGRKA